MTLRTIVRTVHLCLGLTTGLVVFIVCITAAIWAFSPEIKSWTESWRHVEEKNLPFLPLSQLVNIAEKQVPGKKISIFSFDGRNKSAIAFFYSDDDYYTVFLDPYNGEVLKTRNENKTFFRIIILGHYSLWLGETGKEIVKWTSVIFLFMLVTGMILWWPRKVGEGMQRFKIKFNASPKRLNYDLHNILGFYASWIILFAVLTALVWTFDWIAGATYWIGNGGKSEMKYTAAVSKNDRESISPLQKLDSVFEMQNKGYAGKMFSSEVWFAESDSGLIQIIIYPPNEYYKADYYYYDQYSFIEIPAQSMGKYADANGGRKIAAIEL